MINNKENKTQNIDIIFSYEIRKDNKVFIYWYDKLVKIFSGDKAAKFLCKIDGLETFEAQQLMSKCTGNLKRKKDGDTNTIVIRGSHYTRNKTQA